MVEYQIEDMNGAPATVSNSSFSRTTPPSYPAPSAAVTPALAPAAVSPAQLLAVAGCAAVDAVHEIERYAQSRGMTDFAFGAENIQKFAACLFIELSRKGGRA